MKPGEEEGGLQTNKQNGENTRALHLSRDGSTPYPLVGLSSGGTPNQKWEAATAYLRAGHLRGDRKMLSVGADRLADLYNQQRLNGHMAIGKADEAVGDSHVPIWYRASCSARLTLAELRSKSDELDGLGRSIKAWWSAEFSICRALLVPSGPRAGSIVGPGARPKIGWSPVRDFVFQVGTGRKVSAKIGKASLAGGAQDTFACFLARQVAELIDGFGVREDEPPCLLHSPMRVYRLGWGHVANFPKGMEWQKHFSGIGWIVYETGQIGLAAPAPDFAGIGTVIDFPGAAA